MQIAYGEYWPVQYGDASAPAQDPSKWAQLAAKAQLLAQASQRESAAAKKEVAKLRSQLSSVMKQAASASSMATNLVASNKAMYAKLTAAMQQLANAQVQLGRRLNVTNSAPDAFTIRPSGFRRSLPEPIDITDSSSPADQYDTELEQNTAFPDNEYSSNVEYSAWVDGPGIMGPITGRRR